MKLDQGAPLSSLFFLTLLTVYLWGSHDKSGFQYHEVSAEDQVLVIF
jgi:hypothetical protein